jgi:hypothetical protein
VLTVQGVLTTLIRKEEDLSPITYVTAMYMGRRREYEIAFMYSLCFIMLNMVDAFLTSITLSLGGAEFNPIAVGFGANIWLKALIAAGIAVVLLLVGRAHLLKPLSAGMGVVVLWNTLAMFTWA